MGGWRRTDGFTLADLLVSLAVLGFLLAASFSVLRGGLQTYGWGAARVDAQQSARVALTRMVTELRQAGYDPSGAGIAPITVAAAEQVTFQQDLNGNGLVDATRERVSYVLRAGESTLRRDAGAGAQPVIEGVRRFRLTYFDDAGAETIDATRVAAIRIHLEVGATRAAAVMETDVALRNYHRR